MLTQKEFTTAITVYAESMNRAIDTARKIEIPKPNTSLSFSTLGLTSTTIENLAKDIPTGNKKEDIGSEYIYVFSVSQDNSENISDAIASFKSARDYQASEEYDGKKNLCRLNHEDCENRVLYVGRSYKPRERFRQHLAETSNGTYAIHLQYWASELNIKLNFNLYKFSNLGDRVVQIIEDSIWDKLNPILGKRGEK